MKENTRQKLIDITYEEVFTHGYQGASLAEILKKTSVHKVSMYHYFKNKKEMALIAIKEKIHERFFTRYSGILELEDGVIDALFKGLKDTSKRDFKRGCPIANLVQEMSNIDEDFNITMKLIYQKFRDFFQQALDQAVLNKEIKECDTTKVALYITAVIEGGLLAVKASGDEQDYLDTIEILEDYFKSIKL